MYTCTLPVFTCKVMYLNVILKKCTNVMVMYINAMHGQIYKKYRMNQTLIGFIRSLGLFHFYR